MPQITVRGALLRVFCRQNDGELEKTHKDIVGDVREELSVQSSERLKEVERR